MKNREKSILTHDLTSANTSTPLGLRSFTLTLLLTFLAISAFAITDTPKDTRENNGEIHH